jgi:hypothetical protein
MAVVWEDKGFQQFDWSRVEICLLGLHTRSQWSKDNILQNPYIARLFVSFGIKSLANGGRLVQSSNENPNSPKEDKLFSPNLYKTP